MCALLHTVYRLGAPSAFSIAAFGQNNDYSANRARIVWSRPCGAAVLARLTLYSVRVQCCSYSVSFGLDYIWVLDFWWGVWLALFYSFGVDFVLHWTSLVSGYGFILWAEYSVNPKAMPDVVWNHTAPQKMPFYLLALSHSRLPY